MALRFSYCLFTITSFIFCGQILCCYAQSATNQLKIYHERSRLHEHLQPDSAVFYANKGIALAESQNDQAALADFLIQLGDINALHQHRELSRKFYNEALSIFRRRNDAAGVARTYDALGLLDHDQDNFGKALQYYRDSRDSSGISATYATMGQAAEQKGDTDKALSYYLRALIQYEHRNHKPEAYYSLLETIGRLYERKGDTKTALQYFQEGIRDSMKEKSSAALPHLLKAEGEVLEHRHDENQALTVYKEALTDARQNRQPDEQAEALLHIANILKKTDVKGSIADLREALAIIRKLHQPELEARIYEALAGVYQQQKDYGEAMFALEEQRHLVDSLLSADRIKEISALDSSYVLENSREQVTSLNRINHLESLLLWCGLLLVILSATVLLLQWRHLQKVKQLNAELAASNHVKDTLFSIIGHDLKGPAGSAAQLFDLMETEDFTETELRSMIAELRVQTSASLELLQSLFEWGKAQLQGIKVHLKNFDPAPVTERCIRLLTRQAAQKNITLNNELPPHLYIYADADQFELIMRNLLSNAIKFTHAGGHIEVGVQRLQDNELVFYVRDSGIGISPAQQAIFLTSNMQVNFGTGKEKGSGLGLLLVKDFVKANHGYIWLESEQGQGTTFFISLPVAA